jgi:hypothetical protein
MSVYAFLHYCFAFANNLPSFRKNTTRTYPLHRRYPHGKPLTDDFHHLSTTLLRPRESPPPRGLPLLGGFGRLIAKTTYPFRWNFTNSSACVQGRVFTRLLSNSRILLEGRGTPAARIHLIPCYRGPKVTGCHRRDLTPLSVFPHTRLRNLQGTLFTGCFPATGEAPPLGEDSSASLRRSLLLKRGLGLGEPSTIRNEPTCDWVAIQSRTGR